MKKYSMYYVPQHMWAELLGVGLNHYCSIRSYLCVMPRVACSTHGNTLRWFMHGSGTIAFSYLYYCASRYLLTTHKGAKVELLTKTRTYPEACQFTLLTLHFVLLTYRSSLAQVLSENFFITQNKTFHAPQMCLTLR